MANNFASFILQDRKEKEKEHKSQNAFVETISDRTPDKHHYWEDWLGNINKSNLTTGQTERYSSPVESPSKDEFGVDLGQSVGGALQRQGANYKSALATLGLGAAGLLHGDNNYQPEVGSWLWRLQEGAEADTGVANKLIEDSKYGRGWLGNLAMDLTVGAVDLAGDRMLDLVAPGAGLGAMAARVFGGSSEEAREQGKSISTQILKGATHAAVEFFTERFGTTVGRGSGKAAWGQRLSSSIERRLEAKGASKLVQKLVIGFGEEGAEEIMADIFNPLVSRFVAGVDNGDFDAEDFQSIPEIAYDGLIGGLLGLAGGATQGLVAQSGVSSEEEVPTQRPGESRESFLGRVKTFLKASAIAHGNRAMDRAAQAKINSESQEASQTPVEAQQTSTKQVTPEAAETPENTPSREFKSKPEAETDVPFTFGEETAPEAAAPAPEVAPVAEENPVVTEAPESATMEAEEAEPAPDAGNQRAPLNRLSLDELRAEYALAKENGDEARVQEIEQFAAERNIQLEEAEPVAEEKPKTAADILAEQAQSKPKPVGKKTAEKMARAAYLADIAKQRSGNADQAGVGVDTEGWEDTNINAALWNDRKTIERALAQNGVDYNYDPREALWDSETGQYREVDLDLLDEEERNQLLADMKQARLLDAVDNWLDKNYRKIINSKKPGYTVANARAEFQSKLSDFVRWYLANDVDNGRFALGLDEADNREKHSRAKEAGETLREIAEDKAAETRLKGKKRVKEHKQHGFAVTPIGESTYRVVGPGGRTSVQVARSIEDAIQKHTDEGSEFSRKAAEQRKAKEASIEQMREDVRASQESPAQVEGSDGKTYEVTKELTSSGRNYQYVVTELDEDGLSTDNEARVFRSRADTNEDAVQYALEHPELFKVEDYSDLEEPSEEAKEETAPPEKPKAAKKPSGAEILSQYALLQKQGKRTGALSKLIDALKGGKVVAIDKILEAPEVAKAEVDQTKRDGPPMTQEAIEKAADEMMKRGSWDGKGFNGEVAAEHKAEIVIGLPGSGKSSIFTNKLSQENKARVIDTDECRDLIGDYNGTNAFAVHKDAQAIRTAVLERSTDKAVGENVVVSTVGHDYNALKDLILDLKENGYAVNLRLVDIPSSVAIGRALSRYVDEDGKLGRYISPQIVADYGDKPKRNFGKLIFEEGLLDGFSSYDNNVKEGEEPTLLIQSSDTRGTEGDLLRSERDGTPEGSSEKAEGSEPEVEPEVFSPVESPTDDDSGPSEPPAPPPPTPPEGPKGPNDESVPDNAKEYAYQKKLEAEQNSEEAKEQAQSDEDKAKSTFGKDYDKVQKTVEDFGKIKTFADEDAFQQSDKKRDRAVKNKLKALREAFSNAAKTGDVENLFKEYEKLNGDSDLGNFYNEQVQEEINNWRKLVDEKTDTYNEPASTYAAARTMQIMAHKFKLANEYQQTLSKMNETLRGSKNGVLRKLGKSDKLTSSVARALVRWQINPDTVFKMIDAFDKGNMGEGYKLAKELQTAHREKYQVLRQARDRFNSIQTKENKKAYEAFALGKETVKDYSGREWDMRSALSVIKAIDTIRSTSGKKLGGTDGFGVMDSKGNIEYIKMSDVDALKLYESLKSGLSDVAVKYGDAAVEAFNDVKEPLRKKYKDNNGIDIRMVGDADENISENAKKKGIEKSVYSPLSYVTKDGQVYQFDIAKQDTYNNVPRFLRERSENGGTYILIKPYTDVVDGYFEQVSNYLAYSAYGEKMRGLAKGSFYTPGLAQSLADTFGKDMGNWYQNYVEDLKTYKNEDDTEGVNSLLRQGRQQLQQGALLFSVSVPMKQISSYWAASGILHPDSLIKNYRVKLLKPKNSSDAATMLASRAMGNLEQSASEAAKDAEKWLGKLKYSSGFVKMAANAINQMDYNTVSNLLSAVEYDVLKYQFNGDQSKVGTDEYKAAVEELFQDVVDRSQPNFDKQMRAEYGRTDNEVIRMLSMFRTQQTQNLNLLATAIGEYKAAKGTENQAKATQVLQDTIKGQAASALSLSVLTVLADMLLHRQKKYEDDDKELDPTKVLARIGINATEAAAGTLWFGDSVAKWAIDRISGGSTKEFYGVNMGVISTVSDILENFETFMKSPTRSNARYCAGNIATLMGIPLNNAYAMLNSAIMYGKDILGTNEGDYDDILRYLDAEAKAAKKAEEKAAKNAAKEAEKSGADLLAETATKNASQSELNAAQEQIESKPTGYLTKPYNALIEAGMSSQRSQEVLSQMDTDSNNSVKQSEMIAYWKAHPEDEQYVIAMWNSYGYKTTWEAAKKKAG